jgi:hypothetical protein
LKRKPFAGAQPQRGGVAASFGDKGRPLRGLDLFQSGYKDRFGRVYIRHHGSFLEDFTWINATKPVNRLRKEFGTSSASG